MIRGSWMGVPLDDRYADHRGIWLDQLIALICVALFAGALVGVMLLLRWWLV